MIEASLNRERWDIVQSPAQMTGPAALTRSIQNSPGWEIPSRAAR